MKKIKGSIFNSFNFYLIVFVNVLYFYLEINRSSFDLVPSIVVFFVFNGLAYLLSCQSLCYFEYNEQDFYVRNILNPFICYNCKISDIENIKVLKSAFIGQFIQIRVNNRVKNFGINNVSEKELRNMIDEILSLS
jgi:hypothetical protein